MRVFVECRNCGSKIYLETVHDSPYDYPPQITRECSECGFTHTYSHRDLQAEEGTNATAAGAVLGGLAGSLAGPAGAAVGAGVGGALGQNQDQQEKERVREFNSHFFHHQL